MTLRTERDVFAAGMLEAMIVSDLLRAENERLRKRLRLKGYRVRGEYAGDGGRFPTVYCTTRREAFQIAKFHRSVGSKNVRVMAVYRKADR